MTAGATQSVTASAVPSVPIMVTATTPPTVPPVPGVPNVPVVSGVTSGSPGSATFSGVSGIVVSGVTSGVGATAGSGLSGGFAFGALPSAQGSVPVMNYPPPSMKMDKAPKMKGSFDLYAVQLSTFLKRMGCWDVVDGSFRHAAVPMLNFDAKDNAAREAILSGVSAQDAEMICQEATAEAMWNRFVDRQTKREYANYIFVRAEFYSNTYTPDKPMETWLREMEKMRRNLLHYGKQIDDRDFAETLLGHVSRTHRDVVRQFSKHYVVRGSADNRPVPTAAQVMNALRAESALDEKMGAEEKKAAGVAACGKGQKQGKRKRGGRGKNKSKDQKDDNKSGRKETRTCYGCGEVGHIRPNCPNKKRKEDKDEDDDDSSDDRAAGVGPRVHFATSERKRWESKAGKSDDSKRRKVEAVGCISRDTLVVGSVKGSAGNLIEWALDSCSDVHVCNQQDLLSSLKKDEEHVFQAYDGKVSDDEQTGNVHLRVVNSKQPHQELSLQFRNVLFKPNAPDNLLSLDLLEKNGWTVKFGRRDSHRVAWLTKDRSQILLTKSRGRYRLKAKVTPVYRIPAVHQRKTRDNGDSLVRWHLRFAHLNTPTIKHMAKEQVATGMNEKLRDDVDMPCWSCKSAKLTRMSYKRTNTRRATKPYQKLMSDMCYVNIATYDGYKHFQLVQDEASRYLWGFLLKEKHEATDVVMDHIKWLLAQGFKVEVFNSDQGRELLNQKLRSFLRACGIEYTWTNAYSPEENGLVEKMNGVVMARVRCLLKTADMPFSLWGEAFEFAVEVGNVSGTSALEGDTPYFRRFGERPDISNLKTWGCLVFVFTPKVLRTSKLEDTGKPGLFLGYAKHSESYRVLSLLTGNVQEVRSVEFHEEWTVDRDYVERLLSNRYGKGHNSLPRIVPYVRLPVLASVTETLDENRKRRRCDGDSPSCYDTEVSPPVDASGFCGGPLSEVEDSFPVAAGIRPELCGTNTLLSSEAEVDVCGGKRGLVELPNSDSDDGLRHPMSREISPSVGEAAVVEGEDDSDDAIVADIGADSFDTLENEMSTSEPAILMSEVEERLSDSGSDTDEEEMKDTTESFRRSRRVRWPNPRYKDFEVELPSSLIIESVNAVMEPQTVEEALNVPDADKWKEALEKEYGDLMRNCTWELVDRPKNKKVLTSKWVFVRKRDAHGNVVRHRARITIKGCQQRYGVDFWETYSPVVAQEAVKLVLLLALHLGLSCKHVDFVTAFLNGPIDDAEIYMEIPEYFDDGSGRVCKLLRSLYGLKQAPMIWYQTLDKHLRACGFKRCKMDGGVYTRSVGGSPIFVTVYVDDLVIAGTDENIELVISELRAKFKLKDLGPVKDLLHMEIEYVPGQVLWMSQRGYIDKVLKRFGMENCRPVSTPQTLGNQPEPVEEGQAGVNDPNVPYRELVGCLQYLVQGTRPEIANAVRMLSKYMSKYTREHYVMAKRVLRYLQGTRDHGLLWEKPASPDLHFTAYADADLGGEKDDRRSITGYVLQMNGCTYAYKSHKQSITYDDTCSSEFVAAAECSVMIVWTHNLCEELKLRRRHKTVLYQDNQSAIKVIKSTKGNYKVKGVDLKFHRIKDLYERGDFDIVYCPTQDMLADILTKPLGATQFAKLRERLNVVSLPRIECSAKDA